ncbi:hypothetical protein WJX79_004166 [Trebouxia sp. C0005]
MLSNKTRCTRTVLVLLCTVLAARGVAAVNVLGFAVPGARSHQFAVLRVGQELAKRGHNFTLLVSSEEALDQQRLGKRAFDGLSVATFQGLVGIGTQEWFVNQPRDVAEAMRAFQSDQMTVAEHLHADVATIQQLRDTGFDIYLKDCWYWPADVLEDILSVLSVDVCPFSTGMPSLEQRLSIPNEVAYMPQLGTAYHTNMTFLQRVRNYLQAWLVRVLVMRVSDDHTRRFCIKTGQRIRSFEQGTTGAAAVIVSADWAVEHPFPMPPKVQMVGPILAEAAQPLPSELSSFLDQGTVQGLAAVYVCMGSAGRLTQTQLHGMAQGLSALPNPVLWKLSKIDLPGNTTKESLGVGSNIKVVDWAPQNDILGHAAVKAFVTHAGSNGLYEAAFHGKPVVSVPIMNEQPDNAAKAVYHGFGITVLPSKLDPMNGKPIQEAVTRLLHDPAFLANAQQVQKRMSNPRTPAERAADIVEQVLFCT